MIIRPRQLFRFGALVLGALFIISFWFQQQESNDYTFKKRHLPALETSETHRRPSETNSKSKTHDDLDLPPYIMTNDEVRSSDKTHNIPPTVIEKELFKAKFVQPLIEGGDGSASSRNTPTQLLSPDQATSSPTSTPTTPLPHLSNNQSYLILEPSEQLLSKSENKRWCGPALNNSSTDMALLCNHEDDRYKMFISQRCDLNSTNSSVWNDPMIPLLANNSVVSSPFFEQLSNTPSFREDVREIIRSMYPMRSAVLEQIFSRDALPSVTSSCGDSAPTASVVAAMERRIQSCVRRGFWDNVNGSQLRPVSGLRRPSRRALPRTSPYATASSLLDCRPCMDEVQHNVVAGSIRSFSLNLGAVGFLTSRRELTQPPQTKNNNVSHRHRSRSQNNHKSLWSAGRSMFESAANKSHAQAKFLSAMTLEEGHNIATFDFLHFNWDNMQTSNKSSLPYNHTSLEFSDDKIHIPSAKRNDTIVLQNTIPKEVFVIRDRMSDVDFKEMVSIRESTSFAFEWFWDQWQSVLNETYRNISLAERRQKQEGNSSSSVSVQFWFVVTGPPGPTTAASNIISFITVEGETDTGDYQQNALRRSFATIYNAPVYVLQTKNGAHFVEKCPRVLWPHTPCSTKFTTLGHREIAKFPKFDQLLLPLNKSMLAQYYPFQRVPPRPFNTTTRSKARIAICLAGLLRAISHSHTLNFLINNVMNHHEDPHLYVSTWNVVGNVFKYFFNEGTDEVVQRNRLTKAVARRVGKPLIWMEEHSYDKAELRRDARYNSPIAFHFHISHCLRAVRYYAAKFYRLKMNSTTSDVVLSPHYYDAIIVTRPDTSWRVPLVITKSLKNRQDVSLQLEYRLSSKNINVHPLQDGNVVVDVHDTMYWGNAWSAGDWALVGTAGTMLAWEDVYAYSAENYVSQGGGILLASYMCEMNQTWEVGRFDIRLIRIKCMFGDSIQCRKWGNLREKK